MQHKRIILLDGSCLPNPRPSWSFFYGLSIIAVYLLTILFANHPPLLQDYPTWVYEGVAVSHQFAGHADPQFSLKHYPVPNALTDVALGLLVNFFDWRWAAKIWTCLYLLFATFACLHLLRTLNKGSRRSVNYVLMPTVAVANLCFWYGFINFQWAVAMMVLFCSFLLQGEVKIRIISPFLALVFITHAVPFLACCLVLLIYILLTRSYRLIFAYFLSLLLGVWYLYGRFLSKEIVESSSVNGTSPIAYMSKAFLAYKVNTYFKSLGYIDPEVANTPILSGLIGTIGLVSVLCVAFILGILLLYAMIMGGRAAISQHLTARPLWLAIVLLVVISSLCPFEALGIFDPGARFIVCALSLAVLLLDGSGRIGLAITSASVILGIVGAGLFVAISLDALPEGQAMNTSGHLMHLAHVSPLARSDYYDALKKNNMSNQVFDTGILSNVVRR
jgi:hypothetical protein